MRLKTIYISNIKGIISQEIRAGALTIISGSNGQGKSSILDAIKSVFEGGHDPSLIRAGERKGEISILLDDGTTIKKTITEKGSKLDILTKDGAIIPKPQAFIDSLAEGFALDPLGLVTAEPKKRSEFLLAAMPIAFSPEEVRLALGDSLDAAPAIQGSLDLDALAALRDKLFQSRAAANRAVRDAEGTVTTLSQALPDEDSTDWKAKARELVAENAQVEAQISDAMRAADAEAAERERAISKEIEDRISALHDEKDRRIRAVLTEQAAAIQRIEEVAKPERDRIAAEQATARERATAQAKAAGTRESIDQMRKKVRENFLESERLTKAMVAVDALRKRKLDSLPVEGVELRDGDVFVNGIPFDQVNTAQQFFVSFQLAALKAGKLGVMLADRSECLDEESWSMFQEAARGSGFQVIAAKVTEGPLAVEAFA